MNFEMDTREVALLAMKLKAAGATLRPQLNKALKREVEQAAVEARAAAPKDRPWLGTEQGLQVVQKFPLSWSIISPRDPRGQSVGYRVVYGTSKMPPTFTPSQASSWRNSIVVRQARPGPSINRTA